jgi:uncharacterized protein DUF3617
VTVLERIASGTASPCRSLQEKAVKTPLLLALLALAVPALAGESPMKPGMWEITSQMNMPGMPYKMPPMTFKQCVTPEMLARNGGLGEQKSPPGSQCERTKMKISGNRAEWAVSCTGKTNMKGSGTVTWDSADSYHGITHLTMAMNGHVTNITQTMQGKRVGDCGK